MTQLVTDRQHEQILNTIGASYRLTGDRVKQLLKDYAALTNRQIQLNHEATLQKCTEVGCVNARIALSTKCEDHISMVLKGY
jgi:hypothetical protein